jgi:hypothetical protein
LAEAVAYYAKEAEGLGEQFYEAMGQLTAEIEAAPQLHLCRHRLSGHKTKVIRRLIG